MRGRSCEPNMHITNRNTTFPEVLCRVLEVKKSDFDPLKYSFNIICQQRKYSRYKKNYINRTELNINDYLINK